MLEPDKYFNSKSEYFPAKDRNKARKLFRRAIRDYYVMQRKYVIEPETGERVQSVFMGYTIKKQKTQRRKIKVLFNGRIAAGRPRRLWLKLLISRLFILWGNYSKHPASFSWKTPSAIPTGFEDFLFDLLPRLGVNDVRRYVEKHWEERK
jgi:hypothetical protein